MAYPDPNGTPGEPSLRGVLELVPDLVSHDPTEVAVKLRDRHGYVVRIPGLHPALDADVYLVTHPEDVQRILQTDPNDFGPLDVPGAHDFGKVVENSIVSLSAEDGGGAWTQRTRMLSPEFTERAMHRHVPAMVEETLGSLAGFTNPYADTDTGSASTRVLTGDGAVLLMPAMRRLSLRLLGVSLFGADVRAHETQVIDAVDTLRAAFKRRQVNLVTGRLTRHLPEELHLPAFLGDRVGDPHIRLGNRTERHVYAALDALVAAADDIAGRRESTPRAFDDGLATWLVRPDPVTGETLSPETLRQEILGLLIAGHATTSAALTWAFYLLASRPAMQERIHEEARATDLLASLERARAEAATDGNGTPTDAEAGAAFLESLPFTRRVWEETLRLYPALPIFGRTTEREVELGGVTLPEGAHVLVSPYVTQRDPEFWPDPERFDPDRFRPDRAEERHPFAYYPFSGGRHACLGRQVATAEALVVLATTLATHRVEFVDGEMGPHPTSEGYAPEVGVDSAINLQPDTDIPVRFVPRERAGGTTSP